MRTPPLYMDYNAHAPMDPVVLRRMAMAYEEFDANPHATSMEGEAALGAITEVRGEVAKLINARPNDIGLHVRSNGGEQPGTARYCVSPGGDGSLDHRGVSR